MFNETKVLQDKIYQIMVNMDWIFNEGQNIEKAYWATEANTYISGLSSDSDAATVDSALTKAEFVTGITFAGQMKNFFTNAALTQADYLATIENIKYADATGATAVPVCAEELGNRILALCNNAQTVFNSCRDTLNYYTATEISDMVAVLDVHRGIYGSSVTAQFLSEGMTCIEQFKKLINNEAASQGDYKSTVQKWMALAYNT